MGTAMLSDLPFHVLSMVIEHEGRVAVLKPVALQLVSDPGISEGGSTVTEPLPAASPMSNSLNTMVLPAAAGSTRIRLNVVAAALALAKIGIRPKAATERDPDGGP